MFVIQDHLYVPVIFILIPEAWGYSTPSIPSRVMESESESISPPRGAF